ncbi:exported hypothetical protein [Mesorhizobium escarrei]|uniref:Uncharacterized protein n=1 Tax=Mesorhizobium escarrei TaxID=666018 RepID=A0ABM9E8F9_9HYPH|nr:exported hypothetical protein [Mesorhizobium escarrei]
MRSAARLTLLAATSSFAELPFQIQVALATSSIMPPITGIPSTKEHIGGIGNALPRGEILGVHSTFSVSEYSLFSTSSYLPICVVTLAANLGSYVSFQPTLNAAVWEQMTDSFALVRTAGFCHQHPDRRRLDRPELNPFDPESHDDAEVKRCVRAASCCSQLAAESRAGPDCVTRLGQSSLINTHTVAARDGCTNIPLAAAGPRRRDPSLIWHSSQLGFRFASWIRRG